LPAARRRDVLFYLPDGVRPYQDQLTAEVISFFAGVYRRSVAEINAILMSVGLTSVLRKHVHALSKGYNRRLLLALGLLTPHELVLMDEPVRRFRSQADPRHH
jgi:ABC-2 type transport system ATP-binding protein